MHSTATLDKTAKILTVLILVLMIALLYPLIRKGEGEAGITVAGVESLLFALTVFCYYFSANGYHIADGKLTIIRPVGNKVFSLKKLQKIHHYQKIKKGITLRTFGNGGLFGYFGHFYNDEMGRFKLYSTRASDFIILDFGNEKIGISPDDASFIEEVEKYSQPQ